MTKIDEYVQLQIASIHEINQLRWPARSDFAAEKRTATVVHVRVSVFAAVGVVAARGSQQAEASASENADVDGCVCETVSEQPQQQMARPKAELPNQQ